MKRTSFKFFTIAIIAMVFLSSCERVAPNYAGVLMENYGKQGKEDFKVVSGRVSTWEWGTELFQVPLFDQRGEFGSPVTLKAADNTEFNARPTYSYKVIKNRAIDVVFDNKHIDKADTESGKDGFMQSLEDNTNISVLDQQIAEQRKRNELEQLKTEQALITSRGLTKEILYKQFIDKWDGRTPIYGAIPDLIKIQN